jgi:hypothetical protein
MTALCCRFRRAARRVKSEHCRNCELILHRVSESSLLSGKRTGVVDLSLGRAIDFHTHAQESCNTCRDDGCNEFRSGMAACFPNPAAVEGMLPTVQA